MKAVDVLISGRVQGVFFRARAREEAHALGITGWIRNEPDGSVAGHFEGSDDAVDQLVEWCRRGPSYARVERVSVAPSIPSGATEFAVRG
jgi:acylphosphatase